MEIQYHKRNIDEILLTWSKEKHIERGVRTSLENFGHYADIDVYPLYAIGNIARE